jgi:inorganic pyrophosphatase
VHELDYGFVPGTCSPDGDPIEVCVIDADTPLDRCDAEVVALIRRRDGVEDQLVAPVGSADWSPAHIAARAYFQQRASPTRRWTWWVVPGG